MFDKIQFHHFYSVKDYISLQNHFAAMDYDDCYRHTSFNVPKTDLKITTIDYDPEFSTRMEVRMDFKLNFLIPRLNTLAGNYLMLIKNGWTKRNIFTEEARRESAKLAVENLRKGLTNIKKASFLDQDIIELIIEQQNELEDIVKELIQNPYPEIKKKISFNWRSIDVEYLFYLLRLNNQIAEIGNADLSRIIANFFEYAGNDGKYHPVKGSRKHFSDFKKGGRAVNEPNNRLMEIFKSDFFNN